MSSERISYAQEHPRRLLAHEHPEKSVIKENTDWLNQLEGADGSKWQLTPNYCIHRLRKLLSQRATYGIPGSDGTFWSCTWIHLKQDHTVLGLFYGHPLHPFSREERLLFLLVSACWIFYVSVRSAGYGIIISIFITVIVVVPFKKFVRAILECPCFYTQAYTFEHEIDDDEVEGEEGHDGVACIAATAGHAAAIALFLGAVFLTVLGSFQARTLGTRFVVAWFLSQTISVFLTEVAIMVSVSAFKMYCYPNEVKKFQDKWRPHFEGKGLAMPSSMTEVAAKAKRDYIAIKGATAFYLHYREYDDWFALGDSESTLQEMGTLKTTSSDRFGENPMHAGSIGGGEKRSHSFTRHSQEQRQSQDDPVTPQSLEIATNMDHDSLPPPSIPSAEARSFRQSGGITSKDSFGGYVPKVAPAPKSRQSPGAKMQRRPPSAPPKQG